MEARARTRTLAVAAWVGTTTVLACVLLLVLRGRSLEALYSLWIVLNGPSAALALWFGFLVLRRSPGHGAGRLMFALGAMSAAHVLVATVADLRLVAWGHHDPLSDHGLVPADLPLSVSVPLLLMNVLWVPVAVSAVLLIAYFPDGRLRSDRWRWIPVTAVCAVVILGAACTVDAWPTANWRDTPPPVVGALFLAGGVATLAVLTGGIVSFVQRWRASGLQRRRFEAVGGVLIIGAVLGVLTYPWQDIWQPLVHVTFGVLLATYGIAIARFRLHDVEPVVGKGAVATGVTVLAAATYFAIVVGIGRAVGARTDDQLLPLVAVAMIALLVVPTRRLLRRVVDRVIYGVTADRATVFSRLVGHGDAVDGSGTTDIAEVILRATGASRVEIELSPGTKPVVAARSSEDRHRLADDGPVRARVVVGDTSRPLGEIRVHAQSATDLVPDAEPVLHDVAGILALMLEKDRLARGLSDQLAEIRASRHRLVEAQERARRELERDVHDGAQARLIAVRMHLGDLRRRVASGNEGDTVPFLDSIGDEVDAAVRELRELARGLHPPMLEQLGVAAAIRAHLREARLPVEVLTTGAARHAREVEAAAYFSAVELVQNALRHSEATRITVDVSSGAPGVRITVADNGRGYDPDVVTRSGLDGVTDRVSALGGTVLVRSAVGAGTRVTLSLPGASAGASAGAGAGAGSADGAPDSTQDSVSAR